MSEAQTATISKLTRENNHLLEELAAYRRVIDHFPDSVDFAHLDGNYMAGAQAVIDELRKAGG
ncbi:MAG: hypothetical protein GY832_23640 [Chloroflexi bacterium]|nr:hypothetical protein [Chloroflexota bacterium]